MKKGSAFSCKDYKRSAICGYSWWFKGVRAPNPPARPFCWGRAPKPRQPLAVGKNFFLLRKIKKNFAPGAATSFGLDGQLSLQEKAVRFAFFLFRSLALASPPCENPNGGLIRGLCLSGRRISRISAPSFEVVRRRQSPKLCVASLVELCIFHSVSR